MKKRIGSLLLLAAMLVSVAVPAMATGVWHGSPISPQPEASTDNEEIEVVTDNVVTGGYIMEEGTPESRPLEQIPYPVIKITTMAMSVPANAKVDAANPGATAEQKASIMTDSALPYSQNATVNEVVDRYYASSTTSEFIDNYEMSFADRVVSMVEGRLANYSAIQIADFSANVLAIGTDNNSVGIAFSAPGVKVGTRVMVARIKNGSMEFISATAGNGTITFNVNPSNLGTFVLLTYVEQ